MLKKERGLDPKSFKRFRLSKPFGYHPQEVDQKIDQYELALDKALSDLKEAKAEVEELKIENKRLEDQLKELNMELRMGFELPGVEDAVASMVLNDFKHYNGPKEDDYNPEPLDFSKSFMDKKPKKNDDDTPGFTIVQ